MGTLTDAVISTTYKKLVFQKTDNKIYYTNGSDVDTEITTFASALTLSGLITASAGIQLGNNVIKASDGATAITTTATSGNVAINGDLTVTGNDIKSSGATAITMSGANVTIAGDLTITGGNITNAITCDSTLGVGGDLTVSGDDIIIGGSDDATDKTILFKHDAAKAIIGIDDTHDRFIINADNSGAFDGTVLNNDFSIDTGGNCYIKGNLTLTGGNITTALQCASTLGVTGITTLANNLVFTGARDITWPDASGLEMKTTDAGGDSYITFTANAIAVGQPMTCSGKALFSGNSGIAPGTGITAATTCKTYVERFGDMIKTTIYLDLAGLRHTANGDILGGNGTSNPCYITRITSAVNGTIVCGQMTCMEVPDSSNVNIDLYTSTSGTEVEDTAISGIAGSTISIDGGDQTLGKITPFKDEAGLPDANDYLYLTCTSTSGDADYTVGKLLFELWGTV
tara:strand:+ start:577 stop:1950 length:1374 start_codon:yes stop_codon:yes gene_type:complete